VANELGVNFLGEVPIDPRIAEDGDLGKPIVESQPDSPSSLEFKRIAGEVVRKLAVLAIKQPPVADANITWVSS
jgi:ATP-binding protein involved in chromosome partitioning